MIFKAVQSGPRFRQYLNHTIHRGKSPVWGQAVNRDTHGWINDALLDDVKPVTTKGDDVTSFLEEPETVNNAAS